MRRIHFVGRKNSGKTTLVCELVATLSERGYRVGTIKHTHHGHELDAPGKDSYQHRISGAAVVGILTPDMTAAFRPVRSSSEAADRYAMLAPMYRDCHIVLVEGNLDTDAVKFEVWRMLTGAPPIAATNPSIKAVISDDETTLSVPVWKRSDLDHIAVQILAAADLT